MQLHDPIKFGLIDITLDHQLNNFYAANSGTDYAKLVNARAKFIEAVDSERGKEGLIDDAITLASSVVGTDDYLTLEVGIDEVMADYLNSGDISDVVYNDEKIVNGAELCPYTDGPGVYLSRAFLRAFNHEISFNDVDECGEIEPRNSNGTKHNYFTALIYPNPSSSNAVIHVSGNTGIKEILVSDVYGNIVSKNSNLMGINKFDLRIHLPGVYFVKIQSLRLESEVIRIIIIE